MTISTTTSRIQYTGNAVTTAFSFPYRFLANGDLTVTITTPAGATTTQVLGTDYTVTGAGLDAGGTVTMTTPPASGELLTIRRVLDLTQEVDYQSGDPFPAETHEQALDRLTMITQQLDEALTRTLTLPPESNADASAIDVEAVETVAGIAADVSAVAAVDTAVSTVAGIAADVTTVAGIAANVTTVAGSADILRNDLASTADGKGGALVAFKQAGTGAVARTAQDKLRERISVKDFGAIGDGVTNDTAAIQAAINTGKDLIFPAGDYLANNLTQATNFQRFYAHGQVNIKKNANGVLFTLSGDYVECQGIQFVGTGYTGDNVVATGNHPRFVNCSSSGTPGRALKATGTHVQVLGTCGSYSTTDATATGYDIEIGVSGTATLYHQLLGIYSSQATGGILLIDTGSHDILGGQFGKLTIAAGTKPAGVNGGMTVGARILGNVSVAQSGAIFAANQFGAVATVLMAGTSECKIDASNTYVTGATITNNGNHNNLIVREVSTGSGSQIKIGDDASVMVVDSNLSTGDRTFPGRVVLQNNKALAMKDSGGVAQNLVVLSSGDDVTLGYNNGTGNFTNVAGGSGGVYLAVGGVTIAQTFGAGIRPQADNSYSLGTASQKWSVVYAGTGAINTSDARQKQQVREISAAEQAVAQRLKGLIRAFKFNNAVAKKADGARIHFGVIAQDVKAAFEAEGLNGFDYAILCFDEWGAQDEVRDKDGVIIQYAKEAGNAYGVRYDELLAFIIAAM